MAITRRQFIKRGGLVAAGSLLGPSLFANPFVRRAFADIGTRYFVVLFLDGGNDGLNTVVPATSGALRDAYDDNRGSGGSGLRLTAGDLSNTLIGNDFNSGTQLALHPGLIGLKQLWDIGSLAVVQGCGYPEYSLSHEQARVIWQTADPLGNGVGTGWVGRHLAAAYGGSDIPAVNISDSVVGEFKQGVTSVLTLSQLENFGFPYDDDYDSDNPAKHDAFLALCNGAIANPQSTLAYLGNSGRATLLSSEKYPLANDHYLNPLTRVNGQTFSDAYDGIGRSVANDLREVAKVIYAVETGLDPVNIKARFFQVSNGGYDTHSDQGAAAGQHYDLHREVGDSLKLFYDDLADMGAADRVTTLVWSEFSRRIKQNGNGTDHGSQGPMFIIGGAVNVGVYGNHPDIGNVDAEGNTHYKQNADAHRSTDFRDVYGTVLKHWVGLSQGTVQGLLPLDSGLAADYWTVPNFDLGFL